MKTKRLLTAIMRLLEYATNIDDKITIAKVKEMIGALYTRKNDFNKALDL